MASSVNLGAKLEKLIDDLVGEGRYGSRSEVLREGVRLVEEREKRLAIFDAEIMKGFEGPFEDIEVVRDRLVRKYQAMAAKTAA